MMNAGSQLEDNLPSVYNYIIIALLLLIFLSLSLSPPNYDHEPIVFTHKFCSAVQLCLRDFSLNFFNNYNRNDNDVLLAGL